ncbi:hypothetical protein GCM10011391_23070 [Pullulanibacillus camelliae]|uniref:Uncharacterized protein n=1 Tax=Pullulanibacillus camelliae TaxID=1707096 RepID=A0A8J2YHQ8_9BACL|nr:hypothetical protein [Pullulanibacillus camelliae]GGE43673.1 hypothetical protein GCM10011391_23070 [Pullulanibacillus camelliae]
MKVEFEERLRKEFEQRLNRQLTMKEIHFIFWMAKKMEKEQASHAQVHHFNE